MTTETILTRLDAAGLKYEAEHFRALLASHEKEKNAAVACLRQMDKIKSENVRLKKAMEVLSA